MGRAQWRHAIAYFIYTSDLFASLANPLHSQVSNYNFWQTVLSASEKCPKLNKSGKSSKTAIFFGMVRCTNIHL